MSKLLKDCHRCTNKAVNAIGETWCIPMMSGREGIHIVAGDTGATFVFDCDEYTEDIDKTVMKLESR